MRVHPRGAIWRCHLEQLRRRYGTEHDNDPGEDFVDISSTEQPRVQSPGPVCNATPKSSHTPGRRIRTSQPTSITKSTETTPVLNFHFSDTLKLEGEVLQSLSE